MSCSTPAAACVLPRPMGVGGLPAARRVAAGAPSDPHARRADARARRAARQARAGPRRRSLRGERDRFAGRAGDGGIRRRASSGPRARANRRPCEEVPNDPLPERARGRRFRERAGRSIRREFLRVERRAMIESVAQNNGHVVVTLTGGRIVEADAIAAFTGYRPDGALPLRADRRDVAGDRRRRAALPRHLVHHRLPLGPGREAGGPADGRARLLLRRLARLRAVEWVSAEDGVAAVGDDSRCIADESR